MTTLTKGKVMGDLLVHIESPEANLFSASLLMPATGAGGHAVANVVGYPVDYNFSTRVATILLAAGQANVDAFLVAGPGFSGKADSATLPEQYTVVAKSNVVINQDNIATADSKGSAFTVATITGGAGVADMRFVTNPAKISTQLE